MAPTTIYKSLIKSLIYTSLALYVCFSAHKNLEWGGVVLQFLLGGKIHGTVQLL